MAKRQRRRRSTAGAFAVVRRARDAAKNALQSLRTEIKTTTDRLQKLIAEEKSFRIDLFGDAEANGGSRRGRRPSTGSATTRTAKRARRRGAPKADRYYKKLPNSFTLDDVRKLAGRKAGISLAQWSRAKRVRKVGEKYQKVEA